MKNIKTFIVSIIFLVLTLGLLGVVLYMWFYNRQYVTLTDLIMSILFAIWGCAMAIYEWNKGKKPQEEEQK